MYPDGGEADSLATYSGLVRSVTHALEGFEVTGIVMAVQATIMDIRKCGSTP